jgi:hypothetical protein
MHIALQQNRLDLDGGETKTTIETESIAKLPS